MRFWSKGLGRRSVELHLAKSRTAKSGDRLYVKGTMEQPITWDYIMPLHACDLADFLALLREREIAEYLYRSPNRRHIYRTLFTGALRLTALLLEQVAATFFGRPAPAEPTIQVPPANQRRPRSTVATATRRRLDPDRHRLQRGDRRDAAHTTR